MNNTFIMLHCAHIGSVGGGQRPVWRTNRPGEDCSEDHAASVNPAAVRALLRASARRHWLTGPLFLTFYRLCSHIHLARLHHLIHPAFPVLLSLRCCLVSVALWWWCAFLPQVVKFSKTFELMSPLCTMDHDIRWQWHQEKHTWQLCTVA